MKKLHSCVLAAVLLGAAPASAFEVIVGVGYDDIVHNDSPAVAFDLEAYTGPLYQVSALEFRLGAAVEIDTDADLWGGAGLVATLPLGDTGLRIEGSFMPGLYSHSDNGNDLGNVIEFRSQIGASYAVTEKIRIGFSFEHKSNAGIGDRNPGVETLFAKIGYQY